MRALTWFAPLTLAGALLVPQFAGAADKTSEGPKLSDADFVAQASAAGTAEVHLAQLALKQTSDEGVKEFAQMMIKDHTAANTKLASIARDTKTTVATAPSKDAQDVQDRLSGLKGAEFDSAYARQMVTDHEKAVSLFEAEAANGTNSDLKGFAADTLPTLQNHLKHARALNDKLKTK